MRDSEQFGSGNAFDLCFGGAHFESRLGHCTVWGFLWCYFFFVIVAPLFVVYVATLLLCLPYTVDDRRVNINTERFWSDAWRKTSSARKKTCPIVTLSTAIPRGLPWNRNRASSLRRYFVMPFCFISFRLCLLELGLLALFERCNKLI